MSAAQIHNVCRHYGLTEWETEFARLILDYVITDREFGRLLRRRRFRDCLDTMKAVLSDPCAWFFEAVDGPDLERQRALAIAGE